MVCFNKLVASSLFSWKFSRTVPQARSLRARGDDGDVCEGSRQRILQFEFIGIILTFDLVSSAVR